MDFWFWGELSLPIMQQGNENITSRTFKRRKMVCSFQERYRRPNTYLTFLQNVSRLNEIRTSKRKQHREATVPQNCRPSVSPRLLLTCWNDACLSPGGTHTQYTYSCVELGGVDTVKIDITEEKRAQEKENTYSWEGTQSRVLPGRKVPLNDVNNRFHKQDMVGV